MQTSSSFADEKMDFFYGKHVKLPAGRSGIILYIVIIENQYFFFIHY